jgi:hypothetical protein
MHHIDDLIVKQRESIFRWGINILLELAGKNDSP